MEAEPPLKTRPSTGQSLADLTADVQLTSIDWSAPWLAPWRAVGQGAAQAVAAGQTVAQALNATGLAPVQFVPQSALPVGVAYEQFIFDTQQVPTRDGVHDFFNGLCWMQFPQTKKRLNQLQAAQIAESGIQPVRGPARDALTVFDENAAFFVGPDVVWEALARKDWATLFGLLRPAWTDVQLVLFGHALLEKLIYPRKPVTAHVFRAQTAIKNIAFTGALGDPRSEPLRCSSLIGMDAWVAADLSADKLATKPFAHLPVLGVPGWWPGSAEPGFYGDTTVFRAPKVPISVSSKAPT